MKAIPKPPLVAGGAVLAVLFIMKVLGSVLGWEGPQALLGAIFFVLFGVVAACFLLFVNLPPVCESRVCGPRDYSMIGHAHELGIPGGHEPVLQCRCGHKYLRRANRFFIVGPGNYLKKYRIKLNWYSRWQPDH